jgi:glycosyltransferase involved in cell wall biosynthesis
MANNTTIVHVTHEAVGKIGGIGAVLDGLFTSKAYLEAVDRTIIVGPLFTTEGSVLDRLGENGEVLYSSVDGLINPGYAPAFRKLESFYHVGIVYGRRTFIDSQTGIKSSPEVLLFDIRHANIGVVNELKGRMYEKFGIHSDLYEHLWEYEQYVRLAPVAIAALKVLGAAKESTFIIAHEFMGMPTALAALLEPCCNFKTIFYAHEVATIRRIVEEHPSHDIMFYNVIKQAHKKDGLYVNEVFGDQSHYFKHALVEASKFCHHIFAVGNYVVDELRFLAPEFETANIDIVYNGVYADQISVAERLASKEKLKTYCENLLGFKPDYIFTHVTRLVRSKGLWRDLRVLGKIEEQFRARNKTAVLFVLSTEVQQRPSQDIYNMESSYNWPVVHREGWPDLSGGEANFYSQVQEFNSRSRNIKVIFINQFGFQRKSCGNRMPENMEFMDIRKGTDVEFGQSVYEPFGISQVEPLTFGGICVFSNVCGCAGLLHDVMGHKQDIKNIIVANYTDLNGFSCADIKDLLNMSQSVREQIEANESEKVAKQIISHLPQNESEIENMIQTGYALAKNMSWDAIVKNYLLTGLQKTPVKA